MMKQGLFLLMLGIILLGGCAKEKAAIVPYDPNCLWNLQVGRDFAAQGRYELAKEHYLMALASSNSPDTRALAAHELHSVELMIRTVR